MSTNFDKDMMRRIVELERRLSAIERSDSLGQIVIANKFLSEATTGVGGNKKFIQLKDTPTNSVIGNLSYTSYNPAGTPVREMRMTAVEASGADKATYTSLDIRDAGDTRVGFFQIFTTYVAGVLTSIGLNFAKQGASGVLTAIIDNPASSGEGYITIGSRASDPTSAPVGSIWYNSTAGKLRGKNASGVVDL